MCCKNRLFVEYTNKTGTTTEEGNTCGNGDTRRSSIHERSCTGWAKLFVHKKVRRWRGGGGGGGIHIYVTVSAAKVCTPEDETVGPWRDIHTSICFEEKTWSAVPETVVWCKWTPKCWNWNCGWLFIGGSVCLHGAAPTYPPSTPYPIKKRRRNGEAGK